MTGYYQLVCPRFALFFRIICELCANGADAAGDADYSLDSRNH